MGMSLVAVSSLAFAYEDPLLGKWKTIDDQSGYSMVRMWKFARKRDGGYYEGVIVETRSLPWRRKNGHLLSGIARSAQEQAFSRPAVYLGF